MLEISNDIEIESWKDKTEKIMFRIPIFLILILITLITLILLVNLLIENIT